MAHKRSQRTPQCPGTRTTSAESAQAELVRALVPNGAQGRWAWSLPASRLVAGDASPYRLRRGLSSAGAYVTYRYGPALLDHKWPAVLKRTERVQDMLL